MVKQALLASQAPRGSKAKPGRLVPLASALRGQRVLRVFKERRASKA
jgi:hypothetical protein